VECAILHSPLLQHIKKAKSTITVHCNIAGGKKKKKSVNNPWGADLAQNGTKNKIKNTQLPSH